MRRSRLATGVAAGTIGIGTMLAGTGVASAHVHGFTPLGCLTVDNPTSGAAIGFDQAADAAAPLNGPSPIIPLNASGRLPSGGLGAENACG